MKAILRTFYHLLPFALISVFLLAGQTVFSQAVCGFDRVHKRNMSENVEYRKNFNSSEESLRRYILKHKNELLAPNSTNATLFTIPVVVHVIHTGGAVGTTYNPTDAQITGAINYLNQVYNGTFPGTEGVGEIQIQFALATKGLSCTSTNAIDRVNGSVLAGYTANGVNYVNSTGVNDIDLKNFSRWDPAHYYNIWVVNKIDGNDGTSGQFIAGYAYFAGASASLDGTVMLATQMIAGQKTLPHEIGHALNLFHPFEGSVDQNSCPANADCTTDGDEVCDTDPVSYNQLGGIVNFACRTGINSCTGTSYSINTERNYMGYTSCYTLFTAGQKARMLAAMSLPSRASLVNSWSLAGVYPVTPYIAPIGATCTPTTSATGLGGNFAGIVSVSINAKSFSSSGTAADGGYLNKSAQCLYLFTGQRNTTYNFTAKLLGANAGQIRAWIDYNNNGIFDNATEQIYYNANVPTVVGDYPTVSTNFTVPATAVANTALRVRVMDEVSTIFGAGFTINGACYNPTYGQAEDYAFFISSALPVKLGQFTAQRSGNNAQLNWSTLEEQNSKGFDIERSYDGISFNRIGFIPSGGNSNKENKYQFVDNAILQENNYYRLKLVDLDGKYELSNVAVINSRKISDTKFKIFNNPFVQNIDLQFDKQISGHTEVRLLDMTGRTIHQSFITLNNQTRYRIDFGNIKIASGSYLLEVRTGGERYVEKVVKQ
jgi:hypothetical protein